MKTRKFKMLCNGQFIGFIFIGDNHPNFQNCKIGSVWPFERRGTWTNGDLELVGLNLITDIFNSNVSDEEIQKELLKRAKIDPTTCKDFRIEPY
jgi:hypothetical protein